jgi:acetyltransferase EpsM
MKRLFILGAGGLGKEVVDIVRCCKQSLYAEIIFLDDNSRPDTLVCGVKVAGDRSVLARIEPGTADVCVAVGNPVARCKLIEDIERYGHSFITLIDPSAIVRSSATIGKGAIIGAGAVVSCNVTIEAHAVVILGAIVGHDVSIGRYALIGGGANLSGGARIGEGALIGAGASILGGKTVGNWATVAMGAAVFTQVEERTTVLGNPARPIFTGLQQCGNVVLPKASTRI